ncbi:site-specific integrase [Azospirillum soli]|uniref:site-specific integrase n=1 Tax=Azospirillum soli TaxID=1304799 RepID=UPI001AE60C8A|nr:site-specific integrase [Azospirillum soli]MBP2315465.1 integrase [Azospirillum soli]
MPHDLVPSTALALTTVQTAMFGELEVPGGRADRVREIAARAAAYASRARADNTIDTYRSAWNAYTAWCGDLGFQPLAGDPEVVGMYLAKAADRLSVTTLEVHLSAITAAHRTVGASFDRKHYFIRSVLDGIARTKGRRPTRVAAPILPEILARMVANLPSTPKGVRDRAIILLGFGGALRRSEIVALDLADIEFRDRGVKVVIGRSKTDQQGEGQEVAVYGSPVAAIDVVAALKAWLDLRGDAPGPLFVQADGGGKIRIDRGRLAGQAVARIVKGAAERAGYDPTKFAGHSLRAGLATSAANKDAQLHDIMRQTRHKNADVARRYIRDAELWKRNVSQLVFAEAGDGDGNTPPAEP